MFHEKKNEEANNLGTINHLKVEHIDLDESIKPKQWTNI